MSEIAKARLKKEAERLTAKYGDKTGALGSTQFDQERVIPTGILALDYALGTGGWMGGHPVMIYGARDIGKSSTLGFNAIRSGQKADLNCGIIAVEPGFDKDWAARNGVDTDWLVIARPDDGEEAFSILYEWVQGDIVDLIIFDSIGAVLRKTEAGPDGKPNKGGASSLITWGVKNILQPCWKNGKFVFLMNQQRQDTQARIPGQYQPPGGEAIQHACDQIIYLRSGKVRHNAKFDGEDVLIGRELVAKIERNKLAEGTNQKATFDFYQKATEYRPLGLDVGKDIVNTAIRTGVIRKGGAWFSHAAFPGGKINSRAATEEFVAENPELQEKIRVEVIDVLRGEQADLRRKRLEKEAQSG